LSVPVLVIVSGPPGAGKTTVAGRIADEFGLPHLDRDDFKDSLFDSLGWSDRAWSKRVGAASWELLMAMTEKLIAASVPVVIDTNFEPEWAKEWLEPFQGRHPHVPVEIHCHAEASELARRFRERWEQGDRHQGHTDFLADEGAYLDELSHRDFTPVRVGERLVEVDTAQPKQIDWEGIFSTVRTALGEAHGSEDR
jgi:predicted kinase